MQLHSQEGDWDLSGQRQLNGNLEECNLVQPVWKTVQRLLRKLKIELPYDPASPLLGVHPDKIIIQKNTCTPMFIAALFTTAKILKKPKWPLTDEWIEKMWYTYIQWSITQPLKRTKTPFRATWMNLDTIILSKVSQKEKDKYHMWNMVFPYMRNIDSNYKGYRIHSIEYRIYIREYVDSLICEI